MIVWVDVETTGLDPRMGNLLEVAAVATTDDLEEMASFTSAIFPLTAICDHNAWVASLGPFIREMHTKSGLLDQIGRKEAKRWHEALADICAWATAAVGDECKKTPLAGSTVGFDRRWLQHHMVDFEKMFSYRSIDVSSLTELAARWAPAVYEARPKKAEAHRALADVRESIEYLRYYRRVGFVGGNGAIIKLPHVTARKSDAVVTFQPYTIDCPYCQAEHHHGGAGQRRADCDRGEYIVETGGVK